MSASLTRRASLALFAATAIAPTAFAAAPKAPRMPGDAAVAAIGKRWIDLTSRLSPVGADVRIPNQKRSQLDRLYHRVIDDLDALVQAVGLKAAA